MELEVIEIACVPVKPQGTTLQGFVSCVVSMRSYRLFIGGIAIHSDASKRSFRLTYPTKKLHNGEEIPICYPVGRELGDKIHNAIIKEWERLIL